MGIKKDDEYMRLVLNLAKKGGIYVSPNPFVGAVIVKSGKIIAKGYHRKFGADHAELNALKKVRNKAKGATLYVNLEPCSHYGKTPPCTDAIRKYGIKRVVVGMMDPNPLVNGKGVNILRSSGIKVDVGVLADDCNVLNEKYKKWIKTRKPFVFLKSAVTLDGALAFRKGVKTPLGCEATMKRVHRLRSEYEAIAVGINTILIDDPKLTSRVKKDGRNPIRVIFDSKLQIPSKAKCLSEDGDVIIFIGNVYDKSKSDLLKSKYSNLKIVEVGVDSQGRIDLFKALSWLGMESISSLMLEGGAELAKSFLLHGLVDKFSIIYTPKFSKSEDAPKLLGFNLKNLNIAKSSFDGSGEDVWITGYLS